MFNMFCRSYEKVESGMRMPERARQMQQNMFGSSSIQEEKLNLIREGFAKGLSKVEIGRMVATK